MPFSRAGVFPPENSNYASMFDLILFDLQFHLGIRFLRLFEVVNFVC